MLSGLILRRIFDRNQEEFTAADPKTIPTIAVVEEAQAVLNEKSAAAAPYIQWVKEGRKYDLGAVLVTQQPGSIPNEILSQGDNWFLFHLLSSGDLANVRAANAHFGQDILSALLNEPIRGQGVFWSSVRDQQQYPVPLRVLSFEAKHRILDPRHDRPAIETYARQLSRRITAMVGAPPAQEESAAADGGAAAPEDVQPEEGDVPVDVMKALETRLISALRQEHQYMKYIGAKGMAWGSLKAFFLKRLPQDLDGRDDFAYQMVPKAMVKLFGKQNEGWEAFTPEGKDTMWVRSNGGK